MSNMKPTKLVSAVFFTCALSLFAGCNTTDEPSSGATDVTDGTLESGPLALEEAARGERDTRDWPVAVEMSPEEKLSSDAPDSAINSGCSYVQYCNHPNSTWGTTCVKEGCTMAQAKAECTREAQNACGTILQQFLIFYLAELRRDRLL
jgi:hypothetical protein